MQKKGGKKRRKIVAGNNEKQPVMMKEAGILTARLLISHQWTLMAESRRDEWYCVVLHYREECAATYRLI